VLGQNRLNAWQNTQGLYKLIKTITEEKMKGANSGMGLPPGLAGMF